jgi:predicted DNA-binding transcriptional regulator YafY
VLKQNKGVWYLVAYDHSKKGEEAIKIYSLNRIEQIIPGKFEYYKDPTFRPEDYFKYSLGIWHRYDAKPIKVELEFRHPRLMEAISYVPIHQTQKEIRKTNNSMRIEIEVYDTVELESLILGYGKQVEVIKPRQLKDRIRDLK